MVKTAKFYLPFLIPLFVYLIPSSWIPLDGLTVLEHRVIALFLLAALCWVFEPIPVYTTSVLIIVLELIMLSDKSFILFQGDNADPAFGTVLSANAIMSTFAAPVLLLFLGGFFLAMATTKFRLDLNLARVLLRPFGTNPKMILLGLMLITATFSMFMSNTATTAMMLAILGPVLVAFEKDDPGKIAFVIAIPFAANIGGIGTPIGTPPNAIALKYLTGEYAISFGTWMWIFVPFVIVLILFAWFILLLLYPPRLRKMELDIKGKFLVNWKAITVYVTFAVTVVLWMLDKLTGMNAYVIALIPVAVFSVTQIINRDDLKTISWDVLWLVAGGIALGMAMEDTGLSKRVIGSIPFQAFSPYIIVLVLTVVTISMATFMSNTATANLILPIIASLGAMLPSLEPLGGGVMLILVVTVAASLAMSLVVSTPPNAIAYSTGAIQSHQMLKGGLIIGAAGLLLDYVLMYVLNVVGYF